MAKPVLVMLRLLYFSLPLPFLAVCVVMIALDGILGNVNPETVDRLTLVRVMQMRDFRQFSPEMIERLTNRAEQEFGRLSPNPPVFELPALEKNVHAYFQAHRSDQQSYVEINLTLMAEVRFCQWMREYNTATLARKAELMSGITENMRYWQDVYFEYLRSLGQPEPTLAELAQDFQRMIDAFKEDATPEEAAEIDTFAKEMSRALFASEVQKSIMNFLPGFR